MKKNVDIDIDFSPEEVAELFCNLDSGKQARFFNEVGEISDSWDRDFCFQADFIAGDPILTDNGRYVMRIIGEYSGEYIR